MKLLLTQLLKKGFLSHLSPNQGVFGVISGQNLMIFKPGEIINQNETLDRVVAKKLCPRSTDVTRQLNRSTNCLDQSERLRRRVVHQLPRARREAQKKRTVIQLPRAKREAKKRPVHLSPRANSEKENGKQIPSSGTKGQEE